VLADLGALKVVAAVQAGAQHEMALEQRARARENVEYLLLTGVHAADAAICIAKNKIKFVASLRSFSWQRARRDDSEFA
jgi:hypothetical protein